MSWEQLLTDGFAWRNCATVMPPALASDAQVSPLFAVSVLEHALGAIANPWPAVIQGCIPRERARATSRFEDTMVTSEYCQDLGSKSGASLA